MKLLTALVVCLTVFLVAVFGYLILAPEESIAEKKNKDSIVMSIIDFAREISSTGIELSKEIDNKLLLPATNIKNSMKIKKDSGSLDREMVKLLSQHSKALEKTIIGLQKEHTSHVKDLKNLQNKNSQMKNLITQLGQQQA